MAEPGVEGPVWLPSLPPSLGEYLAPNLQPVPLIPALTLLAAVFYLAGAISLWRQGRHWSPIRTASFLFGCLAIIVVMGAGIEGYGLRMFSIFMFQQLTLMMAVPPLLVIGSPGTLLLRATPHGLLGRPVLKVALWGLRSRWGRLAIHPAFMVPLFLLSFYGVYFSGLADLLLPNWYGHVGLELLFLAAGILFTVPLISADPLPSRQTHFGRLLDIFAEMPLHAFFGVVIMMATAPMVKFFAAPPESWNVDPMQDQGLAGGLAWSYGELPGVLLLMFILVRWQRDEAKGWVRSERKAAVDGTPDLDAYNEYLRQLANRPVRRR
ncbi:MULTISPECIES: cytochrome c oxidase assembly protein [Paenarthrobacter]|uniref:Cytochrome c oxidase assembly protein n=1 Tax=Paenarthrobacter ureafaciens TaxID=37931 RepID=A0AAX3ER20_PAEUR|nr:MULTISPECIES: cytochrome c oxidase assembly protein [Paenarthrobacter]MDO5878123.1 cytochrome c oxidase assembly protein [Paenarthrobacter sp. SD-1]NHW49278.1 cytochrome c oxidase assembly protein [Paenarthrobacter sp. MSM-2-10-13]UYV99992.1 cytochrome c oxidase assembly protein [Paenarthrobacter ureafaciens]